MCVAVSGVVSLRICARPSVGYQPVRANKVQKRKDRDSAWRVREGSFKDSIGCIAQTSNGYLWLGTQFGLIRFDGVRPVAWQPPPGQRLPSNHIRGLLATRDGRLIPFQVGP